MIKISIVEDEPAAAQLLKEYLDRYSSERETEFEIHIYENGMKFLMNYSTDTSLVFMDIEMPHMNGLETSARLRETNPVVGLVYVAHTDKYAIDGYTYGAIDYLLKPLVYPAFQLKLDRILKFVNKNLKSSTITLASRTERYVLELNRILYVEVSGLDALFHTDSGCYRICGTLKEVSKKLPKETFIPCSSCCIVNLRHISKIEGNELTASDSRIEISRSRRKRVLEAYKRYCMGK